MAGHEALALDYLRQNLRDVVEFMPEAAVEVNREPKEPQIIPIPVESFPELLNYFYDAGLYFTESMERVLAVMLAANISTQIGGELLWVYVTGPPSSGKSLLCDAISAAPEFSKSVSKFRGLFSGMKTKGGKDVSLIKLINNKTMVIKDWTAVLSFPPTLLQSIYGDLRDAYDGKTTVSYLNNINRDYAVRFAIIAAVTDDILRVNNSHLGERFIAIDISDKTHGSNKHVKTALRGLSQSLRDSFPQRRKLLENGEAQPNFDRLLTVKRATAGFLHHLHKKIAEMETPPHLSEHALEQITEVSRFTARLRGRVVREGQREVLYKPRAEVGIRLGAQMEKLATLLAIVFDRPEVDEEPLKIITQVTANTARGFNYDIVRHLIQAQLDGKIGLDYDQLTYRLGISRDAVRRRLDDLSHLKMVATAGKQRNGHPNGRDAHLWQVVPNVLKMWQHFQVD